MFQVNGRHSDFTSKLKDLPYYNMQAGSQFIGNKSMVAKPTRSYWHQLLIPWIVMLITLHAITVLMTQWLRQWPADPEH